MLCKQKTYEKMQKMVIKPYTMIAWQTNKIVKLVLHINRTEQKLYVFSNISHYITKALKKLWNIIDNTTQ